MTPRGAAIAAALSCLSTAAPAAVVFSVETTIIDVSGGAFSLGEAVTLTFTTRDGLGAPNFRNDADIAYWTHDSTDPGDPLNLPLWADVTVSGATGSFDEDTADPFSSLEMAGPGHFRDTLYLGAGDDVGDSIGLTRGGEALVYVDAAVAPSWLLPFFLGGDDTQRVETTFVDGRYTFAAATNATAYFYTEDYANEYVAKIDALTISGALPPAPVPLPAGAWLLLAGVAGLALARRRPRGPARTTSTAPVPRELKR